MPRLIEFQVNHPLSLTQLSLPPQTNEIWKFIHLGFGHDLCFLPSWHETIQLSPFGRFRRKLWNWRLSGTPLYHGILLISAEKMVQN